MVIKAITKGTSKFPKLNENIIYPRLWYNKNLPKRKVYRYNCLH